MIAFDKNAVFDVVIIGAGPAGCVLASRLSEDPGKQVLLIEAGSDSPPGVEHPDVLDPFPTSAYNNAFHWPDLNAKTTAVIGGGVRPSLPYMQGYGVGGGSNINGMAADRCQPGDYDEWRDLGAGSWGWEDVLPYFKKLEYDLGDTESVHSSMHGYEGPMPVRHMSRSEWAPFVAALGGAFEREGFDFVDDSNADFREGVASATMNNLRDRRVSASMAYLTSDVRARRNLTILSKATADRLNLSGRRVNAVLIRYAGERLLVRGRQVVLSCGAIQSPAFLMRSGIGPGEHLMERGIDVVRAMPGVGANLQNHPCVILMTYLPPAARQVPGNPWMIQNWLRFSSNRPDCDRNDMHLLPFNKCGWHELGSRWGAVAVAVLKPYSKGRVELTEEDPDGAPTVDFNLLADTRDCERLMAGVRFALKVFSDPIVSTMRGEVLAFDSRLPDLGRRNSWNALAARVTAMMLDRTPIRKMLLQGRRLDLSSLLTDDEALRRLVLESAMPEYHPCGTCKMGRRGDEDSVVDGGGRVHGIQALRVVDASIFPTIPRGCGLQFPVLMAAEKISDQVKALWRNGAEPD